MYDNRLTVIFVLIFFWLSAISAPVQASTKLIDRNIAFFGNTEEQSSKQMSEMDSPFFPGGQDWLGGSSSSLTAGSAAAASLKLEVLYYELYFDIDPENGLFRSIQNVTIRSLASSSIISFYLHSDLEISDIEIRDNETNDVSIDGWEMDYNRLTQGQADMEFALVEVNLHDFAGQDRQYYIQLEYSIKPEAIADDVGYELLRFTVSKQGTRALGWPSGAIPVFVSEINYAAPHSIEIKHPNDISCIVTGKRVSTVEEGDYTIETYLSNRLQATAPSFSCDTYRTMTLTRSEVTVEFFYFEGEAISEEILDQILQGILLFKEHLGDTGDRHYQFGYVEVGDSLTGGTSRRNTIFMRTGRYKNLETDLKDRVLLVTFLFHEIAHNWNGFVQGESWSGNEYFLWYQEGGANFLAAWACEKTMGAEAASIFRKYNLERYELFKGYESLFSMKTITSTVLSELPEIAVAYEYAGVVWEQLFSKLGNKTLFSGLSDFTREYWLNGEWNGLVTIDDLFSSFENYTEIDVENFLDQWGTSNAVIEMAVTGTRTEKQGDTYETTVEINVVTDRDYEIFTSLGYSTGSGMELVDVHLTERGKQAVTFTSGEKPGSIEIDPEYKVPRIGVYEPPSDFGPGAGIVILVTVGTVGTVIWLLIRKRRNSKKVKIQQRGNGGIKESI
ncbi:MAG: M1 family aminopeptidase [Candidatus Odinarchaeota archaeon]